MKKYITCLIGVLCMAFAGVCFAGRNEIVDFSNELFSVSVIAEDGKEYQIPGASGPMTKDMKRAITATVGEGKDLPNGKYVAFRYVIKNKSVVTGKVILEDGTEYGSTDTVMDGNGAHLRFTKGKSPVPITYSPYGSSSPGTEFECEDDGKVWAKVKILPGDKLEITQIDEAAHFTLDENKSNILYANVELRWLWFGPDDGSWTNFDERQYIKDSGAAGDKDFTRSGDTLLSPFYDPPQMQLGTKKMLPGS